MLLKVCLSVPFIDGTWLSRRVAHTLAFNMGILHRDISQGNVLIAKDGRGMLIDWDMCVWLENKEEVEKIGQTIVRDYVTSAYA